jgi:glycerophosphoryl diester phosphodiesterase
MDCIAHRGFAGVNPENTLAALEAAEACGPDLIEIDVRRCGSGEIVVVHDDTVDRVTDGTGAVADLALADLRELDVLGTGAGVPTLGEAFAATDTRLVVELKETGLAGDVLDLAAEYGRDPLLSAFDPDALREAPAGTDLALNVLDDLEAARGTARESGCAAIHPHLDCCDAESVAATQEAGFAVNAWTVRSRAAADRLAEAGVDGRIVDAPDYC